MKVEVAVVQMNPKIENLKFNFEKTLDLIRIATHNGAELIVFPECSLTGYCFDNKEETRANALTVGEDWTQRLVTMAKQTKTYIIVGFIEAFQQKMFNSLLVLGPDGIAGSYRKAHLPNLGIDNFVAPGMEPFSVIDTSIGKIGPLICYDLRFPEQARVLALMGADIIVHITNLPITATAQVDFLMPTRAIENRVFLLSADRVGEERGFSFLGRSSIFGVNGEILAQANDKDEMIIYSELDLSKAREKKVFYPPSPGKPVAHINNLFDSRRPELYSQLVGTKIPGIRGGVGHGKNST